MSRRALSTVLFIIILVMISIGYFQGLMAVPFHPDESTQLFTSGDVEIFFQHPADLFWRVQNESDRRQHYRELDAPLGHFIIAAGRWAAGLPALPADWSWAKTWQENQQAGAMPSADLLRAGRLAVALLFPFSVLLFFFTVRQVTNDFTAWVAALLLATNALALLHTRRAMAEGGLLFALTLTLWTLVKAEKRPWLAAVPAALAFCAKQTLAALAPVGLLAVLWPVGSCLGETGKKQFFRIVRQTLLYGMIYIAVVFLLNPFLWSQPIPALQAAIRGRQELASAQANDRPDQALTTLDRKIIGLVGSVYFTPPMIAETANYTANTRAAEAAYLSNPLNTLFRSLPGGAALMIFGLFGFALCCLGVMRPNLPNRRGMVLLLAATLLQTLALLALIPLPWQRYYLPVVPYACLWAAYGLDQIKELVLRTRSKRVAPAQG
jgi:hypothetical protein